MTKHNKYQTQRIKYQKKLATHTKELAFGLFILAVVLVFQPASAHAATINVATGNSAVNDGDHICQLDEAITNINDGARTYTDCVETGTYGTNDTINLPAGTITSPGSGFGDIYKSIKVIGQGKNSSTVSGYSFYLSGSGSGLSSALFKDFKMEGGGAVYARNDYDLTVDSMEFDMGLDESPAVYAGGNLTIRDSYFHGVYSGSGMPLVYAEADDQDTNVTIENSTFEGGDRGLMLMTEGSGLAHTLNALIKNSTFTGMRGNSDDWWHAATGILVMSSYDNTVNYSTINNTFSDMLNTTGSGSALASAIFEIAGGDNATIHHTAQNDLYAVGNGSTAVNYNQYDGSGSGTYTTTSNGGNLSSDNSFASKLTQGTDKHNQTTLASFLGVLADNGGPVPTLALLDGSPAINAGTTASGVTTDARGVARPQGGTFDVGAYELAFNDNGDNGGNNNGGNNNGNNGGNNNDTPGLPNTASTFFKNPSNWLSALLAGISISALGVYGRKWFKREFSNKKR